MRKKSANPKKKENWFFWKASQARGSWRSRARKYGLSLDDFPTRIEIQAWLESQDPVKCYITGSFISTEVVELDHKQPLVRGGKLHLDNVGITSRWFNNIKGQMTEKEFRQLLKLVSKWEDGGQSIFRRLSASNNIYKKGK
jgi:5-methylcytosine-specific restriction endonuclease McrA